MEYLIICIVTLFVSIVALLAGFGLGTVLVPVFAFFFPLPLAIAATAVVHLLNAIFQTCFVGKFAKRSVVMKFGICAAIAAVIGALLLKEISNLKPIASYQIYGLDFNITFIRLIVGCMILLASLFTLVPQLKNVSIPPKYIPLGGLLSGFFGGLSGYQGALRTAFLIKSGLNKEQFIGTSAICTILVDSARIIAYGFVLYRRQFDDFRNIAALLGAASLCALVGTYIGSKLMPLITFKNLKFFVGCILLLLGIAVVLGAGKK